MVKLLVAHPTADELDGSLQRTTGTTAHAARSRFDATDILRARHTVRGVAAASQVRRYAINLVLATQPDRPTATAVARRYVTYGADPRAAGALLLLAKVRAAVDGRHAASCGDVRAIARPVLRHRLVLNFPRSPSGSRPTPFWPS